MTENNKGHQSVLRWHVLDNVPFDTSFEGCIEKYDHPGPSVKYANTAFWYLSPEGVDPYEPVAVAERDGYYTHPVYVLAGIKVLDSGVGDVSAQDMRSYTAGKWENDDQLWWQGAHPGDKLTIALPVKAAGKHRIDLKLTKAKDYGIVQFYLDGKKIGQQVDLYNTPDVTVASMTLGVHDLTAGEHKLTVEIVGANPQAIKSYMFGIDTVTCKPVAP
jgi:hypothetical protein